jgi:predicted enzyme related to lactoylglutathione lyase
MTNPGFFQVPVDDVRRAKKFYQSLPGWKIEPASLERTQGAHPAL